MKIVTKARALLITTAATTGILSGTAPTQALRVHQADHVWCAAHAIPPVKTAAGSMALIAFGYILHCEPHRPALTAIRVMDDAVAVTIDSTKARFIIIMEDVDGDWTAPSTLIGTTCPEGPRPEHTPDHLPLNRCPASELRHCYCRVSPGSPSPDSPPRTQPRSP